MVDAAFMAATVHAVVPGAEVHATDLNGGGDHWHCVVVDASFEGLRSFQRQKVVLAAFKALIADGTVHALDLKCMTPAEVAEKGIPRPFVPHQAGEGMHPRAWD